ncbi:MAG: S9 family peptidase [Methanothrix sp.]|nr:S9 family peptidase [Methanothrix sp.]
MSGPIFHRDLSVIDENSRDAAMAGCDKDRKIIPRSLLFGNPDRITARISPEGSKISFLAPHNGVLNIWVGPSGDPGSAKPVTNDTTRGIRSYAWAFTSRHIIYLQDKNGDENWRIFCVLLDSGEIKDLTPFDGVRSHIQALSPKFPKEAIIGLNKRDPEYHDLFRLNIETGDLTPFLENREFAGFDIDDNFHLRMASKMTADGGTEVFRRVEDGWESFWKVGMEDALTTGTIGFNKAGDRVYLIDSRDRNTAGLYIFGLDDSKKELIAEDQHADFGGCMVHPTEKYVQAVAFNYERLHWKILDPTVAADFDILRKLDDGDMTVVSRTLDDTIWIVAYSVDDGPLRYYFYDRSQTSATFLFTDKEKLHGQPLAKMSPVVISARDGLDLVSYYTLPKGCDSNGDGRPDHPLPMLLYVHGGPWGRDYWGFDPIHQWLANRGYAVLSVNFRGSTGFGKNFINAGNMEWGRKMHDDLVDAVNWAVSSGIADPGKVAIMGGSYGGYATLAGLTLTPQLFACGVDIVGPSNLITLLETIPPYWKPAIEQFTTRVGDFRTEEGRALLKERSPLTYVDRIVRPLLIGQGANDPRVKQNEADQIVHAMQEKGLPVTYVLYPDEGHGFARPENRLSFYAVAEAFLAEHLGGMFEPIGKDFEGASLCVPAGMGEVPGLAEALESKH